jgi:2-polyprenyl-3-methyl-5-hydroxy-6-metoxy-1,4-benzoquinol methylase
MDAIPIESHGSAVNPIENELLQGTAPCASHVVAFPRPAERIKATSQFAIDDIELLVETINKHDVIRGTPWDDFRRAHCVLPSWFSFSLDPFSDEYVTQQHKLWSLFTKISRSYTPLIDEKEAPLANVDAVRRPGYFIRRDSDSVEHASHHVIATGMVVKHCGLKPGDTALEYGAGFGQIALTMARLGVIVDTVDISSVFCDYVKEQAAFFQVPLTPFEGRFGWNPRGAHRYDLILFYEAFHHCADFKSVVHEIKRNLAPTGRVLLAGEPIPRAENMFVPYPWGLRLDAESVVQMRRFGWFELGFTEDFLIRLFANAGFSAQRIECPSSVYGEGYAFKHRAERIDLSKEWLSQDVDFSWNNPEVNGRWTKSESRLYLDATDSFRMLVVDVTNHHPFVQSVEVTYGTETYLTQFSPGERKEIAIKADRKAQQILFRARTHVPEGSSDPRSLGIFVHSISYR